eukprot:Opistho-2@68254
MGDYDDVDIYGDIGAKSLPSYEEVAKRLTEASAQNEDHRKRIERLEKENALLTQQNVSLKKNISCLYKTAKAEIDRKDEENAEIRKRLESLQQQSRSSTRPR